MPAVGVETKPSQEGRKPGGGTLTSPANRNAPGRLQRQRSAFDDVEPQHEPEQVFMLGRSHGVKRLPALGRNQFVTGVAATGRNPAEEVRRSYVCLTRAANLARSTLSIEVLHKIPAKPCGWP